MMSKLLHRAARDDIQRNCDCASAVSGLSDGTSMPGENHLIVRRSN
jgi:hypothetical protein